MTTRIKVTRANALFGANGQALKLGTELEVDHVPAGWKSSVIVLAQDPSPDLRTPITAQDDPKDPPNIDGEGDGEEDEEGDDGEEDEAPQKRPSRRRR